MKMTGCDVKFHLNGFNSILKNLNLEERGKVQTVIDSEVVRLSEPYVPFDMGTLARSAYGSDYGSGLVVYETEYAKKQYFTNKGNGRRVKKWIEVMKLNHLDEIKKTAASAVGR